jgi:hypothetical protein
VRATWLGADDSVWNKEELLLIRLADELHDQSDISPELWDALAGTFSLEQTFEPSPWPVFTTRCLSLQAA